MTCQECHTTTDHKISGMPVHSANEGRVECTDCHDGGIDWAELGYANDPWDDT